MVDVILLLQFFICIYLLILGNENSNNLNISLPLSECSLFSPLLDRLLRLLLKLTEEVIFIIYGQLNISKFVYYDFNILMSINRLLWSNELGVDVRYCLSGASQPAAEQWTGLCETASCPERGSPHLHVTVEGSLWLRVLKPISL